VVNLPEELVQRVISNADGNPFYLEEFIKVLIESGAVIKDENNWHIDSALIENIQIPTTLTGILQARLEHLTTDMENVLQRSAVVGRTFWDGAVASLASPSTQVKEPINITQASLQELQRRGLIFQSEVSIFSDAGEFLFKHALLHDVAYARVLKKTRQEYHHRAAEWLIAASGQRADENAGLIAGHFERAMEKSQAAEWYGRAGDAALRAYVPQAAVDYYRKALELAGGELPSKWRIAILTGLGDSLAHRAHFNEAVEIYLEILDLARIMGNGHGLAQAAVGLERTYVNLGRYEESLQIVEEVEAVIRADSTVTQNELVALLFRKGVSLYYLNHLDRALDVAFEILKISETINALENEAESYSLMGAIYYSRGQHSLSKDYTNRGLQVMRMLGNRVAEANILSNQGDNYRQEGDFQQAKEYFEQSLLIARQIGSVHVEIWCLVNMGYVLADLSCFEESETVLRKALEMTPQEGRYSEQYIYLAQALLGQDKLDQATETALAGFNLSLQENRPYTLGLSWRILAQVISARGTSVSVNVHQSQPETIEPVNSEDCFSRSRDIFAEGGMQSDLAQTYWLWSLHENKSGNSSRASELLNAAREIFQTLDLPLWLKRI
jgi:tetratricopeptide (TPR) repeat protein